MKKAKHNIDIGKAALLLMAWEYADEEDKSTEWMLQYMQDTAEVSLDAVLYFLKETPNDSTHEERTAYWEKRLG